MMMSNTMRVKDETNENWHTTVIEHSLWKEKKGIRKSFYNIKNLLIFLNIDISYHAQISNEKHWNLDFSSLVIVIRKKERESSFVPPC